MKKALFILPMLAAGIASCTSDVPANNEEQSGEAKYLSINIVATPTGGTKADPTAADDYENGTDTENAVTKVRFYFFDENKEAANVKKSGDTWVNYYDWTNPGTSDGEAPNVAKVINAQIVINSTEGDNEPVSVVAIVNPTSDLPEGTISLQGLNEKVGTYNNTASFIMSNAVYADGTSKMEEVSVAGHLYNTTAAAIANPVTIHVERVLAKVTMDLKENLANASGLIKTGETTTVLGESDNDVYVKFLGWNVTNTVDKSRLMKEINVSWPNDLLGSDEPWNWSNFHRSFWAVNPTGLTYAHGKFNADDTDNPNKANAVTSFAGGATYLQENAAKTSENNSVTESPSQVIVAAQLVDKNGNAVEIAEWGFKQYKVADLKTAIMQSLASKNYCKKVTNEGNTTYSPITESDIEFKTASAVEGGGNLLSKDRYYVYAQLTAAAQSAAWVSGPDASRTDVDASAVNTALKDLGHAKIWKDGYTYYYLDIRHLGATDGKPGYYGVVRNHVYKVKVNSVKGLGTPVYDPSEVIIPEKPGTEDTFIAAEIKILSWRIVNNDVDFEW